MYATSMRRRAIQRRTSAMGDVAASDLLNRRDPHAVCAAWRFDPHDVADAVTDQRLAYRGLEADASSFRVGLGRTDDAVRLLDITIIPVLGEPDRATHAHLAVGRGVVDEHVVLDDRLE